MVAHPLLGGCDAVAKEPLLYWIFAPGEVTSFFGISAIQTLVLDGIVSLLTPVLTD